MVKRFPIALRLVLGLGVLMVLGTGALWWPGAGATRPLTLSEAAFTAVSALSVTGLTTLSPLHDLSLAGQIILLMLIQVGGVGFMVLAVLTFNLIGWKVLLPDRLALREALGVTSLREVLQLARAVVAGALVWQGLGAVALWLNWRAALGDGPAAFYAVFHAVSAFCNAGFDLFDGQLPPDGVTRLVMGGLIISGGLGIPTLSGLWHGVRTGRWALSAQLTLILSGLLVVGGTVGLLISEQHGILAGEPLSTQVGLALFQSVSARTAGFAGLAQFETLAPASQLLLMALMFIGTAPASMGGGLTTGTVLVLGLALWSYARGRTAVTVGRRTVAPNTVRRAGAVLTVSLAVVLVATWLILLTHPTTTLDAALFEVVSAFATSGLSLAFTAELNAFGQLVIMGVMFWGRLGALTLIAAFAQLRPPSPLRYPEEEILIG